MFKVKEIEFDCSKVSEETKECIAEGFVEIAEVLGYVPTIKANSEMKIKEKTAVIKFKRPISFNTVNNILVQLLDRQRSVKLDEVEYKPEDKKVEVEVKLSVNPNEREFVNVAIDGINQKTKATGKTPIALQY